MHRSACHLSGTTRCASPNKDVHVYDRVWGCSWTTPGDVLGLETQHMLTAIKGRHL